MPPQRRPELEETLSVVVTQAGDTLYNGAPKEAGKFYQVGHVHKVIVDGKEVEETGPIGPFKFIKTLASSQIVRFSKKAFSFAGEKVTLFYQNITPGSDIMRPGLNYKLDKGSTLWSRLDFLSLMLALFLGTAALPHILIRYYTVPSQRRPASRPSSPSPPSASSTS